jgi:(2Fe-2S) ferredoxin
MSDAADPLQTAARKIALAQSTRHVFLCIGPTCCTPEVGMAAWEALKQHIKEAGLSTGDRVCQRTKVGCLRICCQGPTMLVYPEGTWYSGMTADRIGRFVREHLVEGRPVREWIFAEHGLKASVEGKPDVSATESAARVAISRPCT